MRNKFRRISSPRDRARNHECVLKRVLHKMRALIVEKINYKLIAKRKEGKKKK